MLFLPEGEHHELGLLFANYLIRSAGHRTLYLGQSMPMSDLESFIRLSRSTTVPIATGEHLYGRWEAEQFFKADALQFIQADPEWCGGVSELMKICHIASSYDAHVIPHGHSVHASMHVIAAGSITSIDTVAGADNRGDPDAIATVNACRRGLRNESVAAPCCPSTSSAGGVTVIATPVRSATVALVVFVVVSFTLPFVLSTYV